MESLLYNKSVPPGNPLRRADEIREFIMSHIGSHGSDIATFTANHFGVTRQAVHLHLQSLESEGSLVSEGRTRGKVYSRPGIHVTMKIAGLTEHEAFQQHVQPLLDGLPDNVRSICEYGFTEMVNNVIDHSESTEVEITGSRTDQDVNLTIEDSGVGIFRKIQQECDLDDARLAIFELTKGKLTTDPTRHTGEGIFFTSRVFDFFAIESRGLYLGRHRDGDDWLFTRPSSSALDTETLGTTVHLVLRVDSNHTLLEVFDRYATEQDDYAFNKTTVVVRLAEMGEASFVSRSQAKRIVSRLEQFREVLLDFTGVEEIGPAFADEIFRVFASQHERTELLPVSMNEQVTKMWKRATVTGGNGTSSTQPD